MNKQEEAMIELITANERVKDVDYSNSVFVSPLVFHMCRDDVVEIVRQNNRHGAFKNFNQDKAMIIQSDMLTDGEMVIYDNDENPLGLILENIEDFLDKTKAH